MPTLTETLGRYGACSPAIRWASRRQRKRALKAAWLDCKRGDWLLWIAARIGVDQKILVMAACACARLALPYVPKEETHPLVYIAATHAAIAVARVTNTSAATYDRIVRRMNAKTADAVRSIIPWSAVSAALRGRKVT